MTMLARIESVETVHDRRRADRHLLRLEVPGATPERTGAAVLIHDLSLSGLLIESSAELPAGAKLEIELPEAGLTRATVVWSTGRYLGCRFDTPLLPAAISAARLKNAFGGAPLFAREADSVVEDPGAPAVSEGDARRLGRLRLVGALAIAAWTLLLIPIAFI